MLYKKRKKKKYQIGGFDIPCLKKVISQYVYLFEKEQKDVNNKGFDFGLLTDNGVVQRGGMWRWTLQNEGRSHECQW
jgi:hypothetical protein